MVVFPALARPMMRTRKRLVRVRRFSARFCCLSISSAPWNLIPERDIVCGMPEIVEMVKNQDKRGGQCIIWLCWVGHRSDVTDPPCSFELCSSVRTTLFLSLNQYLHMPSTPQLSFSCLNLLRRSSGLSPDLTINQTTRERVSTNSGLTFSEVLSQSRTMPLQVAIRAPVVP